MAKATLVESELAEAWEVTRKARQSGRSFHWYDTNQDPSPCIVVPYLSDGYRLYVDIVRCTVVIMGVQQ